MRLYTLRIPRSKGGMAFPFDRVSLLDHKDREVIGKLFRYALVFPLLPEERNTLETVYREVDKNQFAHETQNRDGPNKIAFSPDAVLKVLESMPNIVVVVPVNSVFDKTAKVAKPRYISAQRTTVDKTKRNIFSDLTYLSREGEKIRPVCLACPQYVAHMNGQCHLGGTECLTHLQLNTKDVIGTMDADAVNLIPTVHAPAVGDIL